MLQCIHLGHSSSSPTCMTSAYGVNNLITYDKQLIKHEETNQWPATLNSPEDISVPGHSPIINSVIFKDWSKYHAYAMASAKKHYKSLLKTRPVNSAILRATHSSFLRKQDLKKNLSSASDHKDVFLDRPALIFIDYTVFYFILQALYLETTVHLSFITKLWKTENKT